jgi:short subunit dehydrogenase-like uncharacterized protein
MSNRFLIYGATGYTGRLLAEAAHARGLCPVLSARDERRLAGVAGPLGLEHRAARLDGGLDGKLDAALRGVRVVVNAAGPFAATSGPMVDACLRAGAHYLDLSGEVAAILAVARRDAAARARGLMLMPSVGFDVVPSDCLALHVARRVRGARRLSFGVSGLSLASRGSLKTLTGGAGRAVDVRRGGAIVGVPPGSLVRDFDYGAGPRASVALSFGDVATACYTTGAEDVAVYCEAVPMLRLLLAANRHLGWLLGTPAGKMWLDTHVDMLPPGPSAAERASRRAVVVAEAEDGAGRRARARISTPEAYGFSCTTALAIVERVLAGDLDAGFQTPARVYGADFVMRFEGVVREDLEG